MNPIMADYSIKSSLKDYQVKLEKVSFFSPPSDCYAITIGKITKELPQIVLSCYDDKLHIISPDGTKESSLDWSTQFTCLAIGSIKGKNLISGGLDGLVRVINTSGKLVWATDLGDSIKSISLGDFEDDKESEALVIAQANTAILLTSNGSVLWRKTFPSRISSAIIGTFESDRKNKAIIMEQDGKVHILNLRGKIEQSYTLGRKISRGTLLALGIHRFLVTSFDNKISIWILTGEPALLYEYEDAERIRIIVTGKLFDSENDSLVILTKKGTISIYRVIVQLIDPDGKVISKSQLVKAGVDLIELRPLILELSRSFGVSGIPISRLHRKYVDSTNYPISYNDFYTDILAFQNSGQLGGRIDMYGTPDIALDDLLIISTDKFFCMSCNELKSVLESHHQCKACLRFLCEKCYTERESVGYVECPFCYANEFSLLQ